MALACRQSPLVPPGHHNHLCPHLCSPAAKALNDKWFWSIPNQKSGNQPAILPTKSCIDLLLTLIYTNSRK